MKITKILTDLLKQVEKGDTIRTFYGVDEEFTYFSPDGFRAYKIPNALFLIDLSKALTDRAPVAEFKKKFFNDEGSTPAYKTGEMARTLNGKREFTLVKIANDKTYAWVNESYLKMFDDCTFKISSPKSPVFIYESDELVGLVLPVNRKE